MGALVPDSHARVNALVLRYVFASDRYYFREAIVRPAGSLYVSPLDLNVEHGVVEKPERPVIRLANVVTDAQGIPDGWMGLDIGNKAIAEFVGKKYRELFKIIF